MSMIAMPAEWYDAVLPGSRALEPLDECSALPVYETAAALVPTSLYAVDVGCGTGRFAELLRRQGHSGYFGFDFAPTVVEEASRYSPGPFVVADIREWEHPPHLPDVCCYVLLEVLEHLDDDRDALARIPSGSTVVLSVPNFWSASHVRRYAQPREVFERFGGLLDFDAWLSVPFATPGRRIHVFRATRRAEVL